MKIDPSRYPAKVFWSAEDEGYIAIAEDLPGCSAFGEDEAAALVELRQAVAAWIGAAQAAGNPVPNPTDMTSTRASGKVLLRLPRSLHRTIADRAEREGVSINQQMVYLLTMAVATKSSLEAHGASPKFYVVAAAPSVLAWTDKGVASSSKSLVSQWIGSVVNQTQSASYITYSRGVAPHG